MYMRPLLAVWPATPAPTAATTDATAGSARTIWFTCCCKADIAVERDVLRRIGGADHDAGVLVGEKAFGDHDVKQRRSGVTVAMNTISVMKRKRSAMSSVRS